MGKNLVIFDGVYSCSLLWTIKRDKLGKYCKFIGWESEVGFIDDFRIESRFYPAAGIVNPYPSPYPAVGVNYQYPPPPVGYNPYPTVPVAPMAAQYVSRPPAPYVPGHHYQGVKDTFRNMVSDVTGSFGHQPNYATY